MSKQMPAWLKGSLPNWIVVALLGVITWGANVAYTDFKSTISKAVDELHSQDKRISILEATCCK